MEDIVKMVRIQILITVLFIFFKLIRPHVLRSEAHDFLKMFLLSFPNFCEGVIGVLVLTGVGIYLNKHIRIKNFYIYIIAIILTSIYVITQELKIHNLGGENVYDPNDLIFSIIGILIGTMTVFGIKPKIKMST